MRTAIATASLLAALIMAMRGVNEHFVSSMIFVIVFGAVGVYAATAAEKE